MTAGWAARCVGSLSPLEVLMWCVPGICRMKVSRENYIRGARMRKVGAPHCPAIALLLCVRHGLHGVVLRC